MDPRLRVKIGNAHSFGFKKERRIVIKARGDQVLHHFLLRIDGDGLPHQVLKINTVAFAIEPKFHAAVLQSLARHSRSDARIAQHIHRALLQHASAHPALHILARVAFQHHAFDSLQMQKVRQHQPGRAGADNTHLCSDDGHRG